jgi:HK97 family phage major capsid protein
MAASKVKELLDELAAILADLGMLDEQGAAEEAGENVDGTPAEVAPAEVARAAAEAVEARQARYDALLAKAEKIKAAIAKEESFEARKAELTKVLHRAAPAVEVATPAKSDIRALGFRGRLRAFNNERDAFVSGQWLKAYIGKDAEARRWCQDQGLETRDMGGQVNSLGGVLVPEEFSNTLIRLVEQFGIASTIAQNITMSSDTLLVPRRLTGVTGYWIGENTTITTSDPTATMVQLVSKKLAAATRVSNELLQDNAISVADWLAQEFSLEIAKRTDEAFFVGTGTNSYGGIWGLLPKINDGTHTAGIVSAVATHTTLATLDVKDLNSAVAKLPRYALGSAAWFMHPSVWHNGPANLALVMGGNTAANLQDFNSKAPATLLGLPVVWALAMPASTSLSAGDIAMVVGDLSLSSIYATRSQMSIAASDDRYFELDQRAYRVTMRADINHHSLGDTSTAGPVVALKLAAS